MSKLDFSSKIKLEDDRVKLIPLENSDFDNLLNFSLEEPEIWAYSLMQPIGKENLALYLDLAFKARVAEKEYPFIVFDKSSERFAGSTRFYDIQLSSNCLQLGFTWYGKQFQGTGLNKHCKFLLLQYAFETLDMIRVEFRADLENERSIAAMKSIGCTIEGVLRSNSIRANGLRRDSIVLSILADEWFGSVKEALRAKLS